MLGQGDQVGHRVDAEEEADVAGVIPAVEVLGLGEVGVAPEAERAEAGPTAQRGGLVDEARRPARATGGCRCG